MTHLAVAAIINNHTLSCHR